jgi:surface carbohydrate biosynthesis protein
LLTKGYPVVLGQIWAILVNLIEAAPRGAVLFRTANAVQAKAMAQCAEAGHVVLAMDEEALPFTGAGFLENVDPGVFRHSRRFLAQSDSHAETLKAAFPEANITVTGSPRVDLLLSGAHKAEPGPYVLFNTGFGLTNSLWGNEQEAIRRMLWAQPMPDPEVRTRLLYERAAMSELMTLICWLAPQYPVVVRPHPSENAAAWQAVPGIRVVTGSNPIPWILGATVTVHSNSTTGLEAAILGCPAINVSPPAFDAWTDRFAARRVNLTVSDATGAQGPIIAAINGKPLPQAKPAFSAPHGARNIANALAAFLPPPRPISEIRWRPIERTGPQRAKFAAKIAGATALDDSVFLLSPYAPEENASPLSLGVATAEGWLPPALFSPVSLALGNRSAGWTFNAFAIFPIHSWVNFRSPVSRRMICG